MKHKIIIFWAIVMMLLGLLWSSEVLAHPIVFFDGDFEMSSWQSNVYHLDSGVTMGARET